MPACGTRLLDSQRVWGARRSSSTTDPKARNLLLHLQQKVHMDARKTDDIMRAPTDTRIRTAPGVHLLMTAKQL